LGRNFLHGKPSPSVVGFVFDTEDRNDFHCVLLRPCYFRLHSAFPRGTKFPVERAVAAIASLARPNVRRKEARKGLGWDAYPLKRFEQL